METKGSKRLGPQSCDSCGRDFVARKGEWRCPYCGFDNRVGVERCQNAMYRAQEKHRKLNREN